MSFNFSFHTVGDEADVRGMFAFMAAQDLDYPNYHDWLARSRKEALSGYKQGIIALSDGVIVANALYQPHKELPKTVELKNMRVHPQLRGRRFGSFVLRQVEVEAAPLADRVMFDARASRTDVVHLGLACGYSIVARAPLYDSNEEDIIFVKDLQAA